MARDPAPGPIVVPTCAEIKLYWSMNEVIITNVLHGSWSLTGPVNPGLAETLFSGFKTQFVSSAWQGQVSDQCSFTGVGFRDIRYAYQVEYLSTGAAVAGADASGALSQGTAIAVTLKSDMSGKQNRGRVYLPGAGLITATNARTFTQAAGDAAIAFVTGLDSVMNTNGCPMVIAQRELLAGEDAHGNPLPARAAATVDVSSFVVVDHRYDSQRRRLGR